MLKKITQILCFTLTSFVFSQAAGDILFVGFNADGDKDFSVLVMEDLPINTTIYFTDSEPNAAGSGYSDSEGVLKWVTGSSIIVQGTVVVFSDVDSSGNASFGSSIGVLTVENAGFNLNATDGDVIYATYGNPEDNTVTIWISGIQNNNDGTETNFGVTGLSLSSNYVVIDDTASKDGGEYTGVKTDKTKEEYAALIVDEINWTTSTTDGESFIPFSSTSFFFKNETLSLSNISNDEIKISIENQKFIATKGQIVKVLNVLGKKVKNKNILNGGIFLVLVNYKGKLQTFKVLK